MQYREIELTQDKWAVIDALDYALVKPFKWHAHVSKGLWYALSGQPYGLPPLRMHILIMCPPDDMWVDHVNNDGLFNSRSNLRWATAAQNMANRDVPQGEFGSGFRGVTANGVRWKARININGEKQNLGTFDTREEAAHAYDEAARQIHGRFAKLNFP